MSMLKLIRDIEGDQGRRKTFYDAKEDLYIKKYNYFCLHQYNYIRKLTKIAYPNNLIEARRYSNSMRFVWQGQKGEALSWVRLHQSENLLAAVEIFCINDLNRTWPITHGDWSPSNILLDNGQLKLIDFDNISRKTFKNKQEAIYNIHKALRGLI